MVHTSLKTAWRLNALISNSRLPSSSLERSSTSLMSVAKRLLLFSTVSTINRCSGVSSVSKSKEERAIIAFMGVLISWFITARKSLRARMAISASLRAKSRATFCSISRSRARMDSSRIAAWDSATATWRNKKKRYKQQICLAISFNSLLTLRKVLRLINKQGNLTFAAG